MRLLGLLRLWPPFSGAGEEEAGLGEIYTEAGIAFVLGGGIGDAFTLGRAKGAAHVLGDAVGDSHTLGRGKGDAWILGQ